MLTGDAVAKVLKPVAKALDLEDCRGCKNRQESLNSFHRRAADAIQSVHDKVRARLGLTSQPRS